MVRVIMVSRECLNLQENPNSHRKEINDDWLERHDCECTYGFEHISTQAQVRVHELATLNDAQGPLLGSWHCRCGRGHRWRRCSIVTVWGLERLTS